MINSNDPTLHEPLQRHIVIPPTLPCGAMFAELTHTCTSAPSHACVLIVVGGVFQLSASDHFTFLHHWWVVVLVLDRSPSRWKCHPHDIKSTSNPPLISFLDSLVITDWWPQGLRLAVSLTFPTEVCRVQSPTFRVKERKQVLAKQLNTEPWLDAGNFFTYIHTF